MIKPLIHITLLISLLYQCSDKSLKSNTTKTKHLNEETVKMKDKPTKRIKSIKEIWLEPDDPMLKEIASNRDSLIEARYNIYTVFREDGKRIEEFRRGSNAELYEKSISLLDDQGRYIEGILYDPINVIDHWKFIYDEKGNFINKNYLDKSGTLYAQEVNRYDDQNRIIESAYYDSYKEIIARCIYIYHENGLLKEIYNIEAYQHFRDIEHYVYDENNNAIKIVFYKRNYYDLKNRTYIKGKQIRHHTLSYDSNGNWITKKKYTEGVLTRWYERKIVYF